MSTTNRKKLLLDLDSMVKKASDQKTAALKKASIGDGEEDGTRAVQTGAQMASNNTEAAKGTAAMVDGGAKTNPAGKTLEMATEGSTAVSTSGQEGGKGADLDVKHQAANGPEGGIKGDDKAGKTASVKDIVAGLRKIAADMSVEEKPVATTEPKVEKTAAAKLLEQTFAKKTVKQAEESKLVKFLIKAAAEAGLPMGGDPAMAGGMPPADPMAGGAPPAGDPAMGGDPAAAGGGDQIVEQLLAALESGQIDEKQAEQMLMEAAQAGAISEQEIQEAMAALQGGAGGAPAGDPAAGAGAPPADPAMGGMGGGMPAGGMPPAGGEMVEDPALDAKMAAANVGPEAGDAYLTKLSQLYPTEMKAGYELAVKVAQELTKAASIGDKVEDGTKSTPEGESIAGKPDMKPAPAVKGEAVGTEGQQDNDANNKLPAAKTANHEPGHDASADKPGVDKGDVPAADGAPAPSPAPAPAGGAPAPGGESVLNPQDPQKQALLMQVMQELGLTPEMLQQLMAQKPAPCGDPAMAKAAEFKAAVRAEILTKAAQLAEATPKV